MTLESLTDWQTTLSSLYRTRRAELGEDFTETWNEETAYNDGLDINDLKLVHDEWMDFDDLYKAVYDTEKEWIIKNKRK